MTNPGEIRPPQWPLKLMRFFLRKEYLEEIEGDMEEIFFDNAERLSPSEARRIYTWDVVRLLRPALMKNFETINHLSQAAMFKNYFKVSLRGMMKTPVNSIINVFGLAAAIGFCVFAYAFARWTYTTDQFHENKNTVFLTTFSADREGKTLTYGNTPRPLGEMLKHDMTHVKNVCRIDDKSVVIKQDNNVFFERIRFTDPAFLEMFSFPLKWGASSTLNELNSIILSEKMSVKYFGDRNPVGETILMIFDASRSKEFKITGVAKAFPKSRSFSFDFLTNFENLKTYDPTYDMHAWQSFVNATFIQVDDPTKLETIAAGMEKYRRLQNLSAQPEWAITSFGFEPLATLHERTENIKDDIIKSSHDNYISVIFMSAIGGLLLALACSNYINIAIASAAKRLKEIGVRKSIGATRKVVVVQFLVENLVITSLALILGLGLGMVFFIPGFELLWKFSMDFTLTDPRLWIFLPAVLLLTAVASGIYPSLYISRFQVVRILKGNVKFGQRNPLTKIFLGFQLIICCMFITCSVLFTQNTDYLAQRSWGYDQEHAMYVRIPDRAAYEQLTGLMSEFPGVQAMSGSEHHVGKTHKETVIHFPQRDFVVDQLAVDAKYFDAMGLELADGRAFNDQDGSDRQSVLVNESFIRNLAEPGWESPIGKSFRIDSLEYHIVGVVRDFHCYSFDKLIDPIVFTAAQKDDFRFLTVRVDKGGEIDTYQKLQAGWSKLFPETPFDGGLQRDVWGFYHEEISIYKLVWKILAVIAILLATLGLYGLVRLNVAGRTKEFSIRKVLGAGIKNITASITSQYTILFAVALVIGAPAGFFFSKCLIEFSYVYHKPTSPSGAVFGVAIMFVVVVLTISTQIRKVMRSNAVEGLKIE